MLPIDFTSRRVWVAIFVAAMFVSALLPEQYAGYSKPVSMAVVTTVQPLSQPLHTFSSTLRQHVDQPLEVTRSTALKDKVLEQENEIYHLKWELSQAKQTIAALQKLDQQLGDRNYVYRRAGVTGRSADPVSNTLNVDLGARHGVGAGMVVVEGAYLIGRLGKVGHAASTLDPITTQGNRINAVIGPLLATESDTPIEQMPLVQFDADGSNRLTAVVPRKTPVEVGHIARLKDSSWPSVVHGWIIGQVIHVEDLPDDLLRKRVTIRSVMSMRYVDAVTVLVPNRTMGPAVPADDSGVPLAGSEVTP